MQCQARSQDLTTAVNSALLPGVYLRAFAIRTFAVIPCSDPVFSVCLASACGDAL